MEAIVMNKEQKALHFNFYGIELDYPSYWKNPITGKVVFIMKGFPTPSVNTKWTETDRRNWCISHDIKTGGED
jgi:hypothetical protein